MLDSILASNTSPLVTSRVTAIVHASIFDAVNGIERRYIPIHVDLAAPRGASRSAAAVQAAYATLVALFPTRTAILNASREESLAQIASGEAVKDSESIQRGVDWGQAVADDIMAWRSTDGFTPDPPAFIGGTALGQWRPTPTRPAVGLPRVGVGPQFAYMTPWVIPRPKYFRVRGLVQGAPALGSEQYATVFNETKMMGSKDGSGRTPDQTELANFWNGNGGVAWNRIARTISDERHLTLSDNAYLFAALNIAMADAAIACWEAKYHYAADPNAVSWRPITAITLADQDGNPATDVDTAWTPLLQTPAHPEYPSGHSTGSSAAESVLEAYFGDQSSFSVKSEKLPGVLRPFPSFSSALAEVHDARVFGGIHLRTACTDGSALGQAVAQYVMQSAMLPVHGRRVGQISHDHSNGNVIGQGEVTEDLTQ